MLDGKVIAGLCLNVPLCSEDVSSLFSYTEQIRAEGFQAGAASRDAEVARLQFALADSEALELGTAERCDQLRAQINVLREGMEQLMRWQVKNVDKWHNSAYDNANHILETTPEQSLAAYRNKVIEAFVNEFSRHVGGDGEFWLHELQDFDMKEQP